MKRIISVFLLVSLAVFLSTIVDAAQSVVIVEPADMHGWAFMLDDANYPEAIGNFVPGPGEPALGIGSAHLAVLDAAGNARPILMKPITETVKLSDISILKYDTYVAPTSQDFVDISLQINVDYDISDGDTTWQGRLVYEPYFNGTVSKGQWQSWDTLIGEWWFSKPPITDYCTQSIPCLWTDILADYPNIGFHPVYGAIVLKAGGGSAGWAYFDGYVDNLAVKTQTEDTITDFEPPGIVYIDDDWASTQIWTDPDGVGPAHAMGLDAFAKIQDGLDVVAPDGTVEVAAGNYDEQVIVNKGVTVEGIGDTTIIQPSQTTADGFQIFNRINGGPENSAAILVTDTTDNVTVRDLKIDGSNVSSTPSGARFFGILYRGTPGEIDSVRVNDISIAEGNGIYLSGYDAPVTVNITSTIITGYLKNGITANNPGLAATISGNTVTGSGATPNIAQNGIQVGFNATGTISGNTISGNVWTGTYGGSNDPATDPEADGATGILLYMPGPGVEISGNTLTGNQFGIWTVAAPDVDIHDNSLTGLAHTGNAFPTGIAIWSSDMWTVDFDGSEQSTLASLATNTISAEDYGILVRDYDTVGTPKPSLIASDNHFTNNDIQVSANSTGLFEVATVLSENTFDRAVTVDHPSASLLPTIWSSIQDGVNAAADGDTVYVEEGTYEEQVVITKSLTLQGAGAGTVIKSPTTLTAFFTNPNINKPVLLIQEDANVTLRDFKVDGAGRGNANYRFIGIGFFNAGGTVENVTVTSIRETPFSGSQHGVAIYAFNQDGQNRALNVHNTIAVDFQKNGITVSGVGLDAIIAENNVFGMGATPAIAQNGIQVSFGASASVITNTVQDIAYSGSSWTASGILLYQAGDATVEGNKVNGSQANIYAFETNATIRGNSITEPACVGDSCYGIIADDPRVALPNPLEDENAKQAAPTNLSTITGLSSNPLDTVVVENNEITGTTYISGESIGLGVYDGYDDRDLSVSASGNIIKGWNNGVVAGRCSGEGCASGRLTSFALNSNYIASNTTGMLTENIAETLDGELNWWGSAHGPQIASNPGGDGQSIQGNVDYVPWLCDGTDAKPAEIGFQPLTDAATCTNAATRLLFEVQPPATAFTNEIFEPQPVVKIVDDQGNTAINYDNSVLMALASNPAGGLLGGTLAADPQDGLAHFTNLFLNKAGLNYQLIATSGSLYAAYSNYFTVIDPSADLSLTLTAPATVNAGAVFTYTIDMSNAGPKPAIDLSLSLPLPDGVTYKSASGASWSCSQSVGVVTCTLSSLAVGVPSQVKLTVMAPIQDVTLTATASITAESPVDPDITDNSDSVETDVIAFVIYLPLVVR